MAKFISLAVLLLVVLGVGILFAQVMAQFLLPLFLAILLVVSTRPIYEWMYSRCGGRRSLSALLTTLLLLLVVLLPLAILVTSTVEQALQTASQIDRDAIRDQVLEKGASLLAHVHDYADRFGIKVPEQGEMVNIAVQKIKDWLAPAAYQSVQFVFSVLANTGIMLLAIYFFFADGPSMIQSMMHLIPVDRNYQQQLLSKFDEVTRSVVLATLASSIAQGMLAGIGYWCSGVGHVLLLAVLTTVLSIVPFLGALSIWGGVVLWLYLHNQNVAAILLAIWCAGPVSLVDNIVKPVLLQGHSKLHPLLALLSAFGGVNLLGPVGIFVGPMVVVFLQTLLVILRTEIESYETQAARPGVKSLSELNVK
jgi:predicted PurR-regulated permease PerM